MTRVWMMSGVSLYYNDVEIKVKEEVKVKEGHTL